MITQGVTKTIYVLIGLPFAGKTTAVQSLVTPDTLLIERDRYLEDVSRDPVLVAKLKQQALRIAKPISRLAKTHEQNAYNDALTLEYLRRVTLSIQQSPKSRIVVDGTHLQRLSRSFIQSFQDCKCIAVWIDTSPESCIERLRCATQLSGVRKTVTATMIQEMAHVFEEPTLAEGFRSIQRQAV